MNMSAPVSTRGVSARPPVRWRLCWENELQLADHIELSDFFRKTYGPTGNSMRSPLKVIEAGPAQGLRFGQSATMIVASRSISGHCADS